MGLPIKPAWALIIQPTIYRDRYRLLRDLARCQSAPHDSHYNTLATLSQSSFEIIASGLHETLYIGGHDRRRICLLLLSLCSRVYHYLCSQDSNESDIHVHGLCVSGAYTLPLVICVWCHYYHVRSKSRVI